MTSHFEGRNPDPNCLKNADSYPNLLNRVRTPPPPCAALPERLGSGSSLNVCGSRTLLSARRKAKRATSSAPWSSTRTEELSAGRTWPWRWPLSVCRRLSPGVFTVYCVPVLCTGTVYCLLCTVYCVCVLCTVLCTVYYVLWTVYCVCVLCTLYGPVYCLLCTVYCVLCMCTVYCELCSVYCVLCNVCILPYVLRRHRVACIQIDDKGYIIRTVKLIS